MTALVLNWRRACEADVLACGGKGYHLAKAPSRWLSLPCIPARYVGIVPPHRGPWLLRPHGDAVVLVCHGPDNLTQSPPITNQQELPWWYDGHDSPVAQNARD